MKSKSDKPKSLAQLITRRRNQALDRQDSFALIVRIGLLVLIAWLLLTKVFLLTQVTGNDMFPALKDGDLVIGFRFQQTYAQGDVVVYRVDGQTKVGRIAARESDVVTLDESGTMLVNGTPQSGEILYPTQAKEGIDYPFRVPEGHIFILGDHRTETKDSRDFGPVPMEDIDAKVITILRRRGL